jgi:hypothetical protein
VGPSTLPSYLGANAAARGGFADFNKQYAGLHLFPRKAGRFDLAQKARFWWYGLCSVLGRPNEGANGAKNLSLAPMSRVEKDRAGIRMFRCLYLQLRDSQAAKIAFKKLLFDTGNIRSKEEQL